MGQEYGPAQPLYDVARKAYDKVSGFLGDPTKRVAQKAQTMNWKPEPNDEQKEQIKRQSKPLTDKTLGSRKRATKGKASQKARKRQ